MAEPAYLVHFPDGSKVVHVVPDLTSISEGNAITIQGVEGVWRVTAFVRSVAVLVVHDAHIFGDVTVVPMIFHETPSPIPGPDPLPGPDPVPPSEPDPIPEPVI